MTDEAFARWLDGYLRTLTNEKIQSAFKLGAEEAYEMLKPHIFKDPRPIGRSNLVIENHKLKAENERLNKILKQEFNENDELGAEYLGITMVRDENNKLRARLAIASEEVQLARDEFMCAIGQQLDNRLGDIVARIDAEPHSVYDRKGVGLEEGHISTVVVWPKS